MKIKSIALITLTIVSCTAIDQTQPLKLDPKNAQHLGNISIDSLCPNSKVIELELRDSSVIGDVGLVTVSSSNIFIFDNILNCIKVFSLDGKYIDNLVSSEDSLHELGDCSDMCLSPDGDKIAILDSKHKEVKIFSTINLELLYSLGFDYYPKQLIWVNNGFVLFSPYPYNYFNKGYKLSFINLEGDLYKRGHFQNLNKKDLSTKTRFYSLFKTKNGIGYWDISESVIFEYSDDEINSIFSFNNKYLPPNKNKILLSEEILTESVVNDFLFTQVCTFNNYFFLTGYLNRNRITCLYNSENHILYNATSGFNNTPFYLGIRGSQDFPYPFWPNDFTSNGEYLYQVVDRHSLSQFLSLENNEISFNDEENNNKLYNNPIIILKW